MCAPPFLPPLAPLNFSSSFFGLGVATRGRRIALFGPAPLGASGEEHPAAATPQRQQRPTALHLNRGGAAGVYLPFAVNAESETTRRTSQEGAEGLKAGTGW
ncbi:MAG: hypothetical protein B7L53_06520 [Thermofilum sp. NZ13]|nr:MAG: hypothetical protein B7L53_06520 [Thermofilum sp. NZ13]